MKKLENEDLSDLLKEGIHLVDFYADWCAPCQMLMPILENVSDKIDIIKINVDEHQSLARKYRIMSIPTLIFFKNGDKIKEITGFRSKEDLLNEIEEISK